MMLGSGALVRLDGGDGGGGGGTVAAAGLNDEQMMAARMGGPKGLLLAENTLTTAHP